MSHFSEVSTVTGGTEIAGGYVKSGNTSGDIAQALESAWHPGAAVDGTRDTLVLCIMTSNLDVRASLGVREAL